MSESIALNIDCMEYLKTLSDNAFDLAIVDVPYGIGEDGGKRRSGYVTQKNGTKSYVKDGGYEKRFWDKSPPPHEYFAELFRVSKNQIIFGCNYFPSETFGVGRIVWDKCNDGTDQSDGEIAYNSLTKRVDFIRFMWRGMMQGKNLSEGTVQQGNKKLNEVRIHPTQKPVALYEWILNKYAKEGDRILDTHLGSGSSRIAAYNLGFDFVGCEIDKVYFDKQEERFVAHTAQTSLFIDDFKEG